MLFNKLFRFIYPLITMTPLFILCYLLFHNQFYFPWLYFLIQLPIVFSAAVISNNYIKNNLYNFEASEKVLSGVFILGYILFNIVIFAVITKLKLLMLIIPIPTALAGILIYVFVGLGVIHKRIHQGFNELYELHLKDTIFFVSLFSSIKTLIFLIVLICKLNSNSGVTHLFIITFIWDIVAIYLLREERYKFIKKGFDIKKTRKPIYIILTIAIFSFVISNSNSILPYSKIINFVENLKVNRYEETTIDLIEKEPEEFKSDIQIIQSLDSEFDVNPLLLTFWSFVEKIIYTIGGFLVIYFIILPLLLPIIKNLKKYSKVSLKDYFKEVLEAFKFLFLGSKVSKQGHKKNRKSYNQVVNSNKAKIRKYDFYKGIKKYFIKSLKWLERKEKMKFNRGLTVSILLERINKYKEIDTKEDRLKQLYYRDFYSNKELTLTERKEVKQLTKTLLKGK